MIQQLIAGITEDVEVYLNGEFLPLSEAKISVLDRGFIFGDGVYEVVPVYQYTPFRLREHVARLMRSLAKIELVTPYRAEDWEALMTEVAQRGPWGDSLVYLQVTRGVAKRDHAFPQPPVAPTIFLMASKRTGPSEVDRHEGLRAVSFEDMRWLHCDIKSVSLLGNVLAKQYAVSQGVDEVVQFRDGMLTEASSANIWVVKDGTVKAPPKDNLVLEGIRYGVIEELCQREGIPFDVSRPIRQDEVKQADELWLTAATKEVLAITELDGQPVGDGQPGPYFKRIRAAYDALLATLS